MESAWKHPRYPGEMTANCGGSFPYRTSSRLGQCRVMTYRLFSPDTFKTMVVLPKGYHEICGQNKNIQKAKHAMSCRSPAHLSFRWAMTTNMAYKQAYKPARKETVTFGTFKRFPCLSVFKEAGIYSYKQNGSPRFYAPISTRHLLKSQRKWLCMKTIVDVFFPDNTLYILETTKSAR